jgi:DNA gyrase subunit A
VRVPVKSISRIGRATQGVKLVNLKQGDRLIAAARLVESDEAGEAGEEIPEV